MANLIEFPTPAKDPLDLPEPNDDYQAFAPATAQPQFMLAFVFPDGSMTSYRFSNLERMDFTPADVTGDYDVLILRFALAWAPGLAEVRIEGRNFLGQCYYLGNQQIRWLRMLPAGQQVEDPALPVITRIIMPPDPL